VRTLFASRVFALFAACAASAAALLYSAPAEAQLHVDVGAEVGVMKRFLGGRLSGNPDAGFGPVAEIHAHVAVLPMLRAGVYLEHDISPISGVSARQITAGGLRAKWLPPFVRTDQYYTWLYFGLGYAGVYMPSFHTQVPSSSDPTRLVDASIGGSTGGFVDVPIGVGFAYKLRKPWELTVELGTRLGFFHGGAAYDGPTGSIPGYPGLATDAPGNDVFALSLSIGINLDL
jgi:hypothetical protein